MPSGWHGIGPLWSCLEDHFGPDFELCLLDGMTLEGCLAQAGKRMACDAGWHLRKGIGKATMGGGCWSKKVMKDKADRGANNQEGGVGAR